MPPWITATETQCWHCMWNGLTCGKALVKSLHVVPYGHLKRESSRRAQQSIGQQSGTARKKAQTATGTERGHGLQAWDPPTSTYPLWLQIDGKLRLTKRKKFMHGLPIKSFEPGKETIIWLWICSELQTPTYQAWGTFSRSACWLVWRPILRERWGITQSLNPKRGGIIHCHKSKRACAFLQI